MVRALDLAEESAAPTQTPHDTIYILFLNVRSALQPTVFSNYCAELNYRTAAAAATILKCDLSTLIPPPPNPPVLGSSTTSAGHGCRSANACQRVHSDSEVFGKMLSPTLDRYTCRILRVHLFAPNSHHESCVLYWYTDLVVTLVVPADWHARAIPRRQGSYCHHTFGICGTKKDAAAPSGAV